MGITLYYASLLVRSLLIVDSTYAEFRDKVCNAEQFAGVRVNIGLEPRIRFLILDLYSMRESDRAIIESQIVELCVTVERAVQLLLNRRDHRRDIDSRGRVGDVS